MLGSAKWPSCVITFSIEEIPPTANRNWHSDQNKKKKKKRKDLYRYHNGPKRT